MNYFIFTLFVATLGSNVANAYLRPENFAELLVSLAKSSHKKCNIITGSGSDEDIANMRAGIFDDDNQKLKEYNLCIYIVVGALSTDFEMNVGLLETLLPSHFKELGWLQQYKSCFEEAKSKFNEPSDITWETKKCSYKKDPAHFIAF
ncbi:hypothetical protein JTB14_038135 [Gonioctena quinquepunctata]|nr:hypothetical protein JTB14_038135 [Gonioctena quinquepunctata]